MWDHYCDRALASVLGFAFTTMWHASIGLPDTPTSPVEILQPPDRLAAELPEVSWANSNLLLLMDRCAEAEDALRAAWLKAWPSEKAHAAENLCRAMRAADGGTGRALAWLESLDR